MKTLKRLDTGHGRAYVLDKDSELKFFPSVTSILTLKSSAYLADLEEKIGKEDLQKIANRAALRGTAMHKFLENYLVCMKHKGDKDSCLLYTQRRSTDSLLNEMEKERIDVGRSLFYNVYHSGVLEKIKSVVFTEKFLYSETNLFAGTTDFGFMDENKHMIIADFKSASSPRTPDVVDKHKCQLAAYSIAFEEMTGKKVHHGEVWISHPDGLQVELLEGSDMNNKKVEFLDLCASYHSTWEIAPFIEYYNLIYSKLTQ